ncbi:hypothetical protein [Candidatus Amarolinea dominans]|uniref:hypothetical protein n=1 Tax=Candidatus Amarolinea dominans TaxID=3140696 RepID=UPI003134E088|nr:hypothetical protein [Anaerolineae bacterium]
MSPSLARTKILSVTRASLLYTSVPIVPASDSSSQNTMPRVTTGVVTVSAPGTQTLTISSSNPLLLFNLKVALEWDAHNDRQYVARLTATWCARRSCSMTGPTARPRWARSR